MSQLDMLEEVHQDNIRDNSISDTDGVSAEVAEDLGFESPEHLAKIAHFRGYMPSMVEALTALSETIVAVEPVTNISDRFWNGRDEVPLSDSYADDSREMWRPKLPEEVRRAYGISRHPSNHKDTRN